MAKEKVPQLPFYGREFYSDENVLVMSLEQEAVYMRLCWNCWQEGSIPDDAAKLAAICKNTQRDYFETSIWPAVRPCFESTSGARLIHGKVEELRAKLRRFMLGSSQGGKNSAMKRAQAKLKVPSTDLETTLKLPCDSVPRSGQLPVTSYQSPVTNYQNNENTSCASDDARWDAEKAFDELWAAYPAKGRTRRPMSQQYFVDKIRTPETFARVIAAVKGKWESSDKWAKGFIMALPQWIDQECWNEDPEPAGGIAFVGSSLQSTMDPETARRLAPVRKDAA
ncbi:MAG: hypothetical protein WCB12_01315 [Bryobacteraceae bacterium]